MDVEVTAGAGEERQEEEKGVESEVLVEEEEMLVDKKKESETKAGKEPNFVEGIVEDVVESEESESEGEEGESESEKSESEDEKDDEDAKKESREGTQVVSDEGTEVLGSEDPERKRKENEEDPMDQDEEVNQEVREEDRDIVLLKDDDTIDGNKLQEVVDQRTRRRRTRVARRIAEILTAGKDRKRESEPSKAEDEKEEEIPLRRKPRSARIVATEETPIQIAKKALLSQLMKQKMLRKNLLMKRNTRKNLLMKEKEKGSCQNSQLRRKSDKLITMW